MIWLLVIYLTSAFLAFVICMYALWKDYTNGFAIFGHDIILSSFIILCPFVNAYVVVVTSLDWILDWCCRVIFVKKRK